MIKKSESANDCMFPFWASIMPGLAAIIICVLFVYGDAVSVQSEKMLPIIASPHGLKPSGAPEIFNPDTLYQKINGQAELYLSAGFVSLKSQWYEAFEDVDTMIEVNIYHMGDLLNAFSVFSLQRRDNAKTIDVTQFAYQTENSIYLVHGPYYVEILSTVSLGIRMPMMKLLIEQFIRETPIEGEDIHQLTFFPPENLVKGSASMISNDAFGFDLLDNVFTAAYLVDGGRATAYISKQKTPEDAKELVSGLHTYFKRYGGRNIEPNIAIEGAKMIEIMGTFDLMFSIGEYLAGVHEAPTRKQAEKIAEMLAGSLQKKSEKMAF